MTYLHHKKILKRQRIAIEAYAASSGGPRAVAAPALTLGEGRGNATMGARVQASRLI